MHTSYIDANLLFYVFLKLIIKIQGKTGMIMENFRDTRQTVFNYTPTMQI